MRKTAFASVAVLAVVALSASDLLSQAEPQPRKVRLPESFNLPPIATTSGRLAEQPQVQAELREQLRKRVEENAKHMSADDLREVLRTMEQLTIEREFASIIEQLRAIAERGTAERGEPTTTTGEQSLAARKVNLAIQLLKTSDPQTLALVEKALSREQVSPHSSLDNSRVPVSGGLRVTVPAMGIPIVKEYSDGHRSVSFYVGLTR